MTERWTAIPGFEGLYEVSTFGQVRSLDRTIVTKAGVAKRKRGRVLSAGLTRDGYLLVSLWRDGEQAGTPRIHQLVALAFLGPRPDGMEVRHLNGDPADNRLENLTYGTASENQLDKVQHGRHSNAIKTRCAQGHPYDEANTIVNRRGWRKCRTCVSTWAARRYARRALRQRPDVDVPLDGTAE